MQGQMTWMQMFQQLYAQINWQNDRITKLEQKIELLQSDLTALKGQKQFHVDRIEYRFDQLKVERLDGTLTIGITPGTMESIEDFAVNGKNIDGLTMQPPAGVDIGQQISSNVNQYLDQNAVDDMRELEAKYQFPLDPSYQQMVIEDIRSQIGKRVQLYVNQYKDANPKDPIEGIKQQIYEKTKKDIYAAMENFIANLPSKEDEKT